VIDSKRRLRKWERLLNNAAHLRHPGFAYHTQQHTVGERTRPADTQEVVTLTYQLVVRERHPIS
jgi:hypothetical protein